MNEKTDIARLVSAAKDRMSAVFWRILRHPQDAEDALQNALVTIWRRRSQVESHPVPQALILRICTDAAIDQFRRRRQEQVDIDLLKDQLPSTDASPLERLIYCERINIVMTAISRLSPNQSTAIVMKYVLSESHANIAEALGCTTETVREHLARGRERLSQLLAHLESDILQPSATTPSKKEHKT